jgi:FKBP-type peptidyl-prolyl cis-trans isomerase FkpA
MQLISNIYTLKIKNLMKKVLVIVAFSFTTILSGCLKSSNDTNSCEFDTCSRKAPANEIADVQNYLNSKGITATQHCSGVFYIIDAPGSGSSPKDCSNITFSYRGTLTDGSVFDESQTPISYRLNGLIGGWRNVLPMLKAGGRMRMFIPPSLGYGNRQNGSIPANSILIFELTLVDVR